MENGLKKRMKQHPWACNAWEAAIARHPRAGQAIARWLQRQNRQTSTSGTPARTCAAEPICSCSSACRALRSATTDRSFFRLRGCFSPAAFKRSSGSGAGAAGGAAAAAFLLPPPLEPLKPPDPLPPLRPLPLGRRTASGAVSGSAAAVAEVCTPRRCGEFSRRCGEACRRWGSRTGDIISHTVQCRDWLACVQPGREGGEAAGTQPVAHVVERVATPPRGGRQRALQTHIALAVVVSGAHAGTGGQRPAPLPPSGGAGLGQRSELAKPQHLCCRASSRNSDPAGTGTQRRCGASSRVRPLHARSRLQVAGRPIRVSETRTGHPQGRRTGRSLAL